MGEIADWMIEQQWELDFPIERLLTPQELFKLRPFSEQRQMWRWKTADKHVYKLMELTDRHLANIIPYMERRKTEKKLPNEGLRPEWKDHCNDVIRIIKREQQYRQKAHIVVNDKPVIKVRQSKE